jgi:glutathione synthase/RimK-type ligase-like ATP-grasp enzyme
MRLSPLRISGKNSCTIIGRLLLFVKRSNVTSISLSPVSNLKISRQKQPSQIMILSAFDVILMRKDPPFDMNYIYATYFLVFCKQKLKPLK